MYEMYQPRHATRTVRVHTLSRAILECADSMRVISLLSTYATPERLSHTAHSDTTRPFLGACLTPSGLA